MQGHFKADGKAYWLTECIYGAAGAEALSKLMVHAEIEVIPLRSYQHAIHDCYG